MLARVEDLKKGDLILVPSSATLRCFKLLNDPVLRTGRESYKAVKCSTKATVTKHGSTKYSWTSTSYEVAPPEEHNYTKFIDLNYKDVWILARE